MIALGYAFAIEVLLSIVPGSGRKLTLQHYLRSIFLEGRDGFFGIDENIATRFLMPADDAMFRLCLIAGVLVVIGTVTVSGNSSSSAPDPSGGHIGGHRRRRWDTRQLARAKPAEC